MLVKRVNDQNFGDLGVVEFANLPFVCRRIYWITNFVKGSARGHHAHKSLTQFMVVLRGSVSFTLFRGDSREEITLSAREDGIIIAPGTWRTFSSDTSDTVLMVCCDQNFTESDYLRNWAEYQNWYKENL
jgi:dTDP-4-dehydrorhamnose 3,5-epimerase-like enzyme